MFEGSLLEVAGETSSGGEVLTLLLLSMCTSQAPLCAASVIHKSSLPQHGISCLSPCTTKDHCFQSHPVRSILPNHTRIA